MMAFQATNESLLGDGIWNWVHQNPKTCLLLEIKFLIDSHLADYPGLIFSSLRLGVPKGVTATTPQPTRILLEGVNREVVMQFAAHIRAWRVPEPYKGKGIFVNDETIQLKAKKIK